jgi:hypothetical protein
MLEAKNKEYYIVVPPNFYLFTRELSRLLFFQAKTTIYWGRFVQAKIKDFLPYCAIREN